MLLFVLISLSKAGQLAIESVLRVYLERLDRDPHGLPAAFYPFVPGLPDDRTLVIDPRISFGRPVIARRGISTSILVDRINAGERLDQVAEDYDLEEGQVEKALIYEKAA